MKNGQITALLTVLSVVFVALPASAQTATGYAGYFSSDQGIGVYGYSNGDRSAPNIYAPGVQGESNRGVGVYGRGDISNTQSFNNEGGYFEGGRGLFARGTGSAGQAGYGARIISDNYRGMYAQGAPGYYDAYFGGDSGISAAAFIDRSAAAQSLVVNLGSSAIEPGDLVAMVGITSSPGSGQPMLGVAKVDANNRKAVIGVAKQAILDEIVALGDGREYVDFRPTAGSVEPQSYLVVITGGLAPAVNLSSLALVVGGQVGDKIALTRSSELSLLSYQANAIVIGKLAGAIDEINGTIPMFIDID